VIRPADRDTKTLSFVNMVEVHVLDAIRRKYNIPLDKVRIAIDYLRNQFASAHPLADHRLETDGLDLFINKFGQLINVSRAGQIAMRELLQAHLSRIERNDLLLLRLSDAVAELDPTLGRQVHRSYWVTRRAVSSVERERYRVRLVLSNGARVPVSRTFLPKLRADGWL